MLTFAFAPVICVACIDNAIISSLREASWRFRRFQRALLIFFLMLQFIQYNAFKFSSNVPSVGPFCTKKDL